MYVYVRSEPSLWTVGFYRPDGRWEPDSDWDTREDAAKRVHYLNGGKDNNDNAEEEGMYAEYKQRYGIWK